MIGALLNALGILFGALYGLAARPPMSPRTQAFFKSALGAMTAFCGLQLVYENVHGTFLSGLKQILLGVVAILLGNWLGRLLRLQTWSNRVGRHASNLLTAAQKQPPGPPATGFFAATLLFCAAPLGYLGAVADGLQDYFYLLLIKAIMDGLAMLSFVKMFRWPVALAALPVFVFFNALAHLVNWYAKPWLEAQALTGDVGIVAGLITGSVALVILEVRRVELTNYLPALAVAPLLGYWLR